MGKAGLLHPTIHVVGKFAFDIAGPVDAARREFGYEPVVSLAQDADAFAESIAPASEERPAAMHGDARPSA